MKNNNKNVLSIHRLINSKIKFILDLKQLLKKRKKVPKFNFLIMNNSIKLIISDRLNWIKKEKNNLLKLIHSIQKLTNYQNNLYLDNLFKIDNKNTWLLLKINNYQLMNVLDLKQEDLLNLVQIIYLIHFTIKQKLWQIKKLKSYHQVWIKHYFNHKSKPVINLIRLFNKQFTIRFQIYLIS